MSEIKKKITVKAEIEMDIDDLPVDIGWAWVVTIEKGNGHLIMVRKNLYGDEAAKALATRIIRLLRKAEGQMLLASCDRCGIIKDPNGTHYCEDCGERV